jgi:hypothetical protein
MQKTTASGRPGADTSAKDTGQLWTTSISVNMRQLREERSERGGMQAIEPGGLEEKGVPHDG